MSSILSQRDIENGWKLFDRKAIKPKKWYELFEVRFEDGNCFRAWWNGTRWDSGRKIRSKAVAFKAIRENYIVR